MNNTVHFHNKTYSLPKPRPQTATTSSPLPTDTFEPTGLPKNQIMGGLDSPCFYNGKVMTIREARELSGWVDPTPPTQVQKPTLQDLALDPKDLMR